LNKEVAGAALVVDKIVIQIDLLLIVTLIIIENLPRQVWAPRQIFRKGDFDAKMA